MKIKLMNVDLNLFDGEGGGAAGEGGEGSATGETNTPSAAGKKAGAYANVKFGKQDDAEANEEAVAEPQQEEGITTTSDTLEERRKAYQDLINSEEYKEFYTEDTQKMINRRFKETKNLEKQLADYQPLLDLLTQRYGVNDVEGVIKAIEDDDSYWETAAYDAGMSVEQFKKIQKLERENKALMAQQQEQHKQELMGQTLMEWQKQEAAMQELYPGFSLDKECESNPEFFRLISSNVPIQHAYEVTHMDEIKNNLMQYSAQRTAKAVTDHIRAKGSRPLENGTSAQGAFTIKSDVNKLTKQDREEIARRVARGEVISF